jgi:adenine C2-methylase RlmN of 23S rRNA A2503 and tRNA A37
MSSLNPPFEVIKSELDKSVNFIQKSSTGFIEARYVRREEEYFIAYLSSMTGCPKSCKFCHLTASNQKSFDFVTIPEFMQQANIVMNHYNSVKELHGTAQVVHYNWMARGEALANPLLLKNAYELLSKLTDLSIKNDLIPKFNISTIMPYEISKRDLSQIFPGIAPTIYYSLYSLSPAFRKAWLPAAINPLNALDKLAKYQQDTKKIVKLHWAFIKDQNDDLETLEQICNAVKERDLKVEFNLVRYNPYSPLQGEEPSEEILQRNLEFLKENLDTKSKLISKVGFDVKASCGMFVEG